MKRFYRAVGVAVRDGGFAVELDGRPVRTPGKRPLVSPSRVLSEAVAAEWDAQIDEVAPDTMRLTRLVNSAIDHVIPQRRAVLDETHRFATTDLVCYRAADPSDLVARQNTGWQPLIDWAAGQFGARLIVTTGIMPGNQPAAALAALRSAVEAFDDFPLAGLHAATAAAGSIVIGLALAHRRIDADAAWALSQLDESFQIERWGEDSESAQRRERLKTEIATAAEFIGLCEGRRGGLCGPAP